MQILVNDKNEITSYVVLGEIEGSVEFEGTLPEGFEENFRPNFYLFKDGEIVINPNYQEPVIADPRPSATQQQLAQVAYQQMMTTQDVTTLQTQNAQMAYQLMMMQKRGGEA